MTIPMDKELKQALTDLVTKFHIGDFIYTVREQAFEDEEWYNNNPDVSSWDHPDVKRYSECVAIIEKYSNDHSTS